MDIKAQIAPKGLEFKAAEFVISDKYATILTVIAYPKYITPGFLSHLTSSILLIVSSFLISGLDF